MQLYTAHVVLLRRETILMDIDYAFPKMLFNVI